MGIFHSAVIAQETILESQWNGRESLLWLVLQTFGVTEFP